MLPHVVERQIALAEAVAEGHRVAASYCSKEQEALRARLVEGAQTITVLIALLETATWAAATNRQTILEMQR